MSDTLDPEIIAGGGKLEIGFVGSCTGGAGGIAIEECGGNANGDVG